jgi:DNA-damage-inducible protein D
MTDLTSSGQQSPFDAIQLPGERWSARALQAATKYSRWEDFAKIIERAIASARNSGHDAAQSFSEITEKPTGGGRPRQDYLLSRFGAYLTVMNGDPNMPEIAAAQAYFAIKTREAETAPALTGSELLAAAVLEAQSMIAAKDQQIAALEPKAEFFDNLMDANGLYSMESVAKSIGYGRNVMMRDLRRLGILQGNNLPYQRHAHHFKVIPGTYANRKTGELVPTATTWVRPSGLDYLRRKLAEAVEAVQLSIGADA